MEADAVVTLDPVLAGTGHAAAVVTADGIRFAAIATGADELACQLAKYLQARCRDTLWPAAAARVDALVDDGRHDDAIATYFANVGERWDEEWLVSTLPERWSAPVTR